MNVIVFKFSRILAGPKNYVGLIMHFNVKNRIRHCNVERTNNFMNFIDALCEYRYVMYTCIKNIVQIDHPMNEIDHPFSTVSIT